MWKTNDGLRLGRVYAVSLLTGPPDRGEKTQEAAYCWQSQMSPQIGLGSRVLIAREITVLFGKKKTTTAGQFRSKLPVRVRGCNERQKRNERRQPQAVPSPLTNIRTPKPQSYSKPALAECEEGEMQNR